MPISQNCVAFFSLSYFVFVSTREHLNQSEIVHNSPIPNDKHQTNIDMNIIKTRRTNATHLQFFKKSCNSVWSPSSPPAGNIIFILSEHAEQITIYTFGRHASVGTPQRVHTYNLCCSVAS